MLLWLRYVIILDWQRQAWYCNSHTVSPIDSTTSPFCTESVSCQTEREIIEWSLRMRMHWCRIPVCWWKRQDVINGLFQLKSMAVSHHECKCGKSPGCFVWWISFNHNSNLQNLFGKICKSQSSMTIRRFDIYIIAVTGMTAPISKFLDGSSEAVTFSGRLVTFWYSWLSKKGQSWALQMKPLIYRATFEWNISNRISCAFVLSVDSASYRITVLHKLGI